MSVIRRAAMRIQFCHSNIPAGSTDDYKYKLIWQGRRMGSIELKMSILTGFVGGLIMVLAEGLALHQKLSR